MKPVRTSFQEEAVRPAPPRGSSGDNPNLDRLQLSGNDGCLAIVEIADLPDVGRLPRWKQLLRSQCIRIPATRRTLSGAEIVIRRPAKIGRLRASRRRYVFSQSSDSCQLGRSMAFPGIRIVMRPVPSSFQQLLTLSALRRGDLTNSAIRKCSRQIARPGWITVCTYAKALDVPCPPHCNNLPWDQCVIVSNSDEFPQGRGEEFSTAMRSRIASLEGGPLRYHAEVLLCGRCKHRMSFSSTESDVMSVYPPPGDPPSLEKDHG